MTGAAPDPAVTEIVADSDPATAVGAAGGEGGAKKLTPTLVPRGVRTNKVALLAGGVYPVFTICVCDTVKPLDIPIDAPPTVTSSAPARPVPVIVRVPPAAVDQVTEVTAGSTIPLVATPRLVVTVTNLEVVDGSVTLVAIRLVAVEELLTLGVEPATVREAPLR